MAAPPTNGEAHEEVHATLPDYLVLVAHDRPDPRRTMGATRA